MWVVVRPSPELSRLYLLPTSIILANHSHLPIINPNSLLSYFVLGLKLTPLADFFVVSLLTRSSDHGKYNFLQSHRL